MELVAKFVNLAIPIEQDQLKQLKLNNMNVLGIGNAIVDVICKVNDDFLIKNGLTKSTMKLINEEEFKKISSNLKIENNFPWGTKISFTI